MISYFDVWKKKMNSNGDNETISRLNSSKDFFNREFKNDPSYKLAKLKIKDINVPEINIDTRIVNIDTNTLKKRIYFRPNTKVETGDYIIYPDKTYLVLEVEDNLISPYATVQFCNHLFKWIIDGIYYEQLGIANNQTKYTEGIKNENNVGLTEVSAMFSGVLPDNQNTRTLVTDIRFILNRNAWRLTQPDYTSTLGLYNLLLGKDSISEVDDVENEIADAILIKQHIYTFNIPSFVQISKNKSTPLIYSIKDETDKDIDYSKVKLTTDSDLININNNNGEVSISGQDIGAGNIKLSIILNNKLEEKLISFEVKDSIIENILYNHIWSNGTSLYLSSSTTLTIRKYNNDEIPCNIEYTIDSVGQSLLDSKQIDIQYRGSNVIWIKNSKCMASNEFTINIIDKDSIDKTTILTEKINLKAVE